MIETDVSASIRIEGARRGVVLMRNNSGAFEAVGRWVQLAERGVVLPVELRPIVKDVAARIVRA